MSHHHDHHHGHHHHEGGECCQETAKVGKPVENFTMDVFDPVEGFFGVTETTLSGKVGS